MSVFVASHPAFIRQLICKTYFIRRAKLVELWYSALLKELSCFNFDEQTAEWKLQKEALAKLQTAKERFTESFNIGSKSEVQFGYKGEPGQFMQRETDSYSQNTISSIKKAFDHYKNECSEILSIIKKLSAVKEQNMKILSTVQEIYSKHQIYIIEEPFLSDIFRFKFREFIQVHDELSEQIDLHFSGAGSEQNERKENLQQSARELKGNYETKFTELKEKMQEEIKSNAQKYDVGSSEYRKQVNILGTTYKSKLSKLIEEFRSKCSQFNNFDKDTQQKPEKPAKGSSFDNSKLLQNPISGEISRDLEKILEGFWRESVTPQLKKFHHYLEETLSLTLLSTSEEKKQAYKVLHSLQIAKRRFGDALWYARRDATSHLLDTRKHFGPNSSEYLQAKSAILEEWQENIGPHVIRFTEELQEIDKLLLNMYERQKIDRKPIQDDAMVSIGDVNAGKIFDVVISPLILDYDACLEDVSQLNFDVNTPEYKHKFEALKTLKKARSIFDENISQLKSKLKSDLGQQNLGSEILGKLIKNYRDQLAPLVDDFENQIESINSALKQISAKQGSNGRRELSEGMESPWSLHNDNKPTKGITNIINCLSLDEKIVLPEPLLDDIYRHCYRSVVIDYDTIFQQLQRCVFKEDTGQQKVSQDALRNLENALSEYGNGFIPLRKKTGDDLSILSKKFKGDLEAYGKNLKELEENSKKRLKSLRDGLDSKLKMIQKTLSQNNLNVPSIPSKSQSRSAEKQQPSKLNDDLLGLLRAYWIKFVLPLLQEYHDCLENAVEILESEYTDSIRKLIELLRSLKFAKRQFGDALWDARYNALHTAQEICGNSKFKLDDFSSESSSTFNIFRKKMKPYYTKFKNVLSKSSQALTDIYKHKNLKRSHVKFKQSDKLLPKLDDLRLLEIFDVPFSILIFEYDTCLENLSDLRVAEDSPQKQSKFVTLNKLQQTRIAFENAIQTSKNKLQDKLARNELNPNEIPKMVGTYEKDLAGPTNTFKSGLNTVNNDLNYVKRSGKPVDRGTFEKCDWSPWKLPTGIKYVSTSDENDLSIQEYRLNDRNTPHPKNISSKSSIDFKEKQTEISEPVIYDSFQRTREQIFLDFDTVFSWIVSIDCQPDSPLYKVKQNSLVKLKKTQAEYKKTETDLQKHAVTDLKKLRGKFFAGSQEYRQALYTIVDENDQKLRAEKEAFHSKLNEVNNYVRQRFPNIPRTVSKETHREINETASVEIDEELTLLLNDFWRREIFPKLCEYHRYLEEINFLQLDNSQKENETIYELLRTLQMSKRLFGNKFWSHRRTALQNLTDIHKTFGKNTIEYVNALKNLKDTWTQKMTPHLQELTKTLFTVNKRLKETYGRNIPKKFSSPVDGRIKFDNAHFVNLFEDCFLVATIYYDSLLESVSELPVGESASRGQSKAEIFHSLQQAQDKFRKNILQLRENLQAEFMKGKDKPDVLQELYDSYKTKMKVPTSEFKSELDTVRTLLNDSKRSEKYSSLPTHLDNSLKSWHPPSEKTLGETAPQKRPTLNKSDDQEIRYHFTKCQTEEQTPQEPGFHSERDSPRELGDHKPPLRISMDKFVDFPILSEPILEEFFQLSYRKDIEDVDAIANLLTQQECQSKKPLYKQITEAIKQLQAALEEYLKNIIDLRKAAISDLMDVSQTCKLGSPEYWQQVSSLIRKYKAQLKTLQDKFRAKLEAIQELIKESTPKIETDEAVPKHLGHRPNLCAETNKLIEMLDKYWLTSLLPQFRRYFACLKDITYLLLHANEKMERLYELLTMLLKAKRRFDHILWLAYRNEFTNPQETQIQIKKSLKQGSDSVADILNAVRQKTDPYLSKFEDKINSADKAILDIYEGISLSRSKTYKGGYTGELRLNDDRLEDLFNSQILIFFMEYDSRLENLGLLFIDANKSDGNDKIKAMLKIFTFHDSFIDELFKLKKELYALLQNQAHESGALDEFIKLYKSKIAALIESFKSNLHEIDTIQKKLKNKVGITGGMTISSSSIIPWRHPFNIVKINALEKNPTSRSNETTAPRGSDKTLNHQSIPKKSAEDSNTMEEQHIHKITIETPKEASFPRSKSLIPISEIHANKKQNQTALRELILDDTFRDEYRIVITSYDRVINILKKQKCDEGSSSYIFIQDSLKQLQTFLINYIDNFNDLKKETSIQLTQIDENFDLSSQENRKKVSSLLRYCNDKLKILLDKFNSECNNVRKAVTSRFPDSTQSTAVNVAGSKGNEELRTDIDLEIDKILSPFWKTEILPKLLKFHRCLEDINSLMHQLDSAVLKELYMLLRSLQSVKRTFGDILWHGRHDVTEQLEESLKGISTKSKEYFSTAHNVLSSWLNSLAPQVDVFSGELEKADKFLNDFYKHHNLKRSDVSDDHIIFHFDDVRFEKYFYDATLIIIIEYDFRLDDLSKLILDAGSAEGRLKFDAVSKLVKAWSDLFASILKIKKELMKKLQVGKLDSNSISRLIKLCRSKLEGAVSIFKSLLNSIDSVLKDLTAKLGLTSRKYTSSISLSPWCIHIKTENEFKRKTNVISAVANALL